MSAEHSQRLEGGISARIFLHPDSTSAPALIVLVPGLGMSGRYMLPTAHALAQTFNVLVPDLPGFGHSTRPAHALGVGELAAALHTSVQSTGLGRPVLLGNSYGCQIAIEAARRDPAWCRGLVLVSPTIDAQARTATAQIVRWLRNAPREPLREGPVAIGDYRRAGARRLLSTLRDALADRPEDKLPELAVPILVVRGSRDPIVPLAWAQQVAALAPQGELESIAGAAHTANFSHPAELAELVSAFAARL